MNTPLQTKQFEKTAKKMIPLFLTAFLFFGGLGVFGMIRSYTEAGHGRLLAMHFVLCAGFYISFMLDRKKLAGFFIALVLVCLWLVVQKSAWKQDYAEAARAGQFFPLMEYVERYPTYESYLYTSMFGGQNWVDFSRDCIEPIKKGSAPGIDCNSIASIESAYGINVKAAVQSHFMKAKRTAQKIQRGQFAQNPKAYGICIKNGECVEVPLLPEGIDLESEQETKRYQKEISAFWSFMDDKRAGPKTCDYITLCNYMKTAGVLDENNL